MAENSNSNEEPMTVQPDNGQGTQQSDNSEAAEQTQFRMGDDLVAVIRELVQLTLLTGTNIVDHLRGVRVEVKENEAGNKLVVPTEEYIEAYNAYVEDLAKKAEQAREQMQQQQASDEGTQEQKSGADEEKPN